MKNKTPQFLLKFNKEKLKINQKNVKNQEEKILQNKQRNFTKSTKQCCKFNKEM